MFGAKGIEMSDLQETAKEPETEKKDSSKSSNRLKRNAHLGKYRLTKKLGMGGFCEVWKARDTVEGIWVALKIPHADINGKRDNQTILREVRLVAQLRHQHIMPVKNAEIINGHAVLATGLSERTLDDCSRPMSPRRIISIASRVLEGLSHAHQKKMVHCDVTPANIFLFADGNVAIGDFGIGLKIKGRMKTVDDFGTPGYVAPEQAYGRPTYRSDCFSVGLILYEYLTGYLPGWPFKWPFKWHERLGQKTSADFVKFMKQSLAVYPAKRFTNAKVMLAALRQATPRSLKDTKAMAVPYSKKITWQQARRQAFVKRYKKIMPVTYPCVTCGEPVTENMTVCPWCRSDKNRFADSCSPMTLICPRCHKGISPQWEYCPWCYGVGFEVQDHDDLPKIPYHDRCKSCDGKLSRFMHYCPWCHRKVKKPWQVWPFPELCSRCGWSVDSTFWNYCPWCKLRLIQ